MSIARDIHPAISIAQGIHPGWIMDWDICPGGREKVHLNMTVTFEVTVIYCPFLLEKKDERDSPPRSPSLEKRGGEQLSIARDIHLGEKI